MSQISIATMGSSPVGPFVATETGNTGGAVAPDGSNNLNVIGDGTTITVVGNPGTNTLTISAVSGSEVLTLTGNTGGAVGPTVGGTINVVGDGSTIMVTGNPGTNTLTISAGGSVYETTTTNATPFQIATVAVSNNEAILLSVQYIAAYSTFADALSSTAQILATNNAGVLSLSNQEGDTLRTSNVPNTAGLTFGSSGTNITVNLTGVAATTINWKLYISYITYP